jgi:hypothetical protein
VHYYFLAELLQFTSRGRVVLEGTEHKARAMRVQERGLRVSGNTLEQCQCRLTATLFAK